MAPEEAKLEQGPAAQKGAGVVSRWLKSATDDGLVQLVQGSGFIFGCRVGGALLVLVTQWVLARWMGAEDLGSYLLAYSWCILVARLSGLGYNSAAPRFIGKGIALNDRSTIRGYVVFSGSTVLAVSTATALIGASAAFVLIRRSGGDPWPMVVAFAAVPIMATIGTLQGFALSFSWFRAAFIPNTVLRPALFLAVACLIWWLGGHPRVTTVMLLQAGSMVVALTILLGAMGGALKRELGDVTSSFEVGRWTPTALSLLIISLFRDYLPESSIIVAGLFLSSEDIAVFTIGYKVASLISFLLFAVDAFTMPGAAQAQALGDKALLQAMAERATRLTFFGSLCAVVGFWIFGRWMLGLFGAEFVDGYGLLLMIALAQLVRAAVGPVLPLLTVGGHERECLNVYGVSLVLVAPLVVVLAPAWGVEGVGFAVASVIVFSSLALSQRVTSLMGVRPSILAALAGRRAPAGQ